MDKLQKIALIVMGLALLDKSFKAHSVGLSTTYTDIMGFIGLWFILDGFFRLFIFKRS